MASFRKSKNLGGGIKLNFSKSGVGVSVGKKGLRAGIDANGDAYTSVGANGVYQRKKLTGGSNESNTQSDVQTIQPSKTDTNAATVFLMAGIVDFFILFGRIMQAFFKPITIISYIIGVFVLIGITANRKTIFNDNPAKSKKIRILRILALVSFAAGFFKFGFFFLPAIFLFFSFL